MNERDFLYNVNFVLLYFNGNCHGQCYFRETQKLRFSKTKESLTTLQKANENIFLCLHSPYVNINSLIQKKINESKY